MKHIAMLKKLYFAGIIFCILPFSTVLSGGPSPLPLIQERRLLSGEYKDSDSYYDYYDIGDGKYAVSLKETQKNHNFGNSGIVISEVMNGHNISAIWYRAFQGNPTAKITINAPIQTIDFEAFIYSKITSITIPHTVSKIGDGAFYSATKLATVTFKNTEASEESAACECEPEESSGASSSVSSSSEEEIEEASEEEEGEDEGEGDPDDTSRSTLKTIPAFCFFNCGNLKSLSLPSAIENIEYEAFNGCSKLATPLSFQNIKIIRERAFQGCSALRSVYISASLFDDANGDGIEPHAFNYCHNELSFYFCGDKTDNYADIVAWENNHPNWGLYSDYTAVTYKNDERRRKVNGATGSSGGWVYSINNDAITITSYLGGDPNYSGFLTVPSKFPDYPDAKVRIVKPGTFDSVKSTLKRLYLPKTLWTIEEDMFDASYTFLKVIADSTECRTDFGKADDAITPRIDLHRLTDLEFIGTRAFLNMYCKQQIKRIHLPYNLIAVGDDAFGKEGTASSQFKNVTSLKWDYKEPDPQTGEGGSRLETIGANAFFKMGVNDEKGSQDDNAKIDYSNNTYARDRTDRGEIELSTIVFPRTFRYFGITTHDRDIYMNRDVNPFQFTLYTGNKYNRPAHAFTACPLISTVIFKGSMEQSKTSDLIIPCQTFVFNDSLQTIIIEERKDHHITFHTQNGAFGQEAIGSNSGRYKNDFRGDPFLQTLVLPNQYTKLHIQHGAFRGNSRAAIYFTGNESQNMIGHIKNSNAGKDDSQWTGMVSRNGSTVNFNYENVESNDLSLVNHWKKIATEKSFSSSVYDESGKEIYQNAQGKYEKNIGLYFNDTNCKNTFDIDQEIPTYFNIHYKDTYKLDSSDTIDVEVGDANNVNELYIDNTNKYDDSGNITHQRSKCAYVCHYDDAKDNRYATMSKYLYNTWDKQTGEESDNDIITTAKIAESVTVKHKVGESNPADFTFPVKVIGESAFSAAYCDGKDRVGQPTPKILSDNGASTLIDLEKAVLPNSITEIKKYAFLRAYGVTQLSSYTGNTINDDTVPSNLISIGQNAFSFTSIKQLLKIPDDCKFYENEVKPDAGGKTTSVFANNLGLRKITFGSNGSTQSTNYLTTTYTNTSGDACTTAIYSKTPGGTFYNQGRLLLILNRDPQDKFKASSNPSTDTSVTLNEKNKPTKIIFNGQYHNVDNKTKPFLFGAYKMGFWIDDLDIGPGTVTKDGNGADTSVVLTQPLFSAVCDRSKNGDGGTSNGKAKHSPAYLGIEISKYPNWKCDLAKASGEMFKLPAYAFNGCDKLKTISLPDATEDDTFLPEGLFSNNTDSQLKYETSHDTNSAGLLDLTTSGYTKIAKDTFKDNPAITDFIAPEIEDFTLDQGCFSGCENLTTIDFRKVSGKLQLNANCFKGCEKLTTIYWPTAETAEVRLDKDGSFEDCIGLTSVTLPANLSKTGSSSAQKLGNNLFKGCTSLQTVSFAGDESYITSIGTSTFEDCSNLRLSEFDFNHLTALTTIGTNAFKKAGSNASSDTYGNVTFPAVITTFKNSCFTEANVKTIKFSCSTITLETNVFYDCNNLEAVRFGVPTCDWNGTNAGIFSGCEKLTELQLPTGHSLDHATGSIVDGDTLVKIYSYKKISTGLNTTATWRNTGSGDADIYFIATEGSNLSEGGFIVQGVSGVAEGLEGTLFWQPNPDGSAKQLGVASYDGSTITFKIVKDGVTTITATIAY